MKHTILMAISGLALLAGCQSGQPKMNCNLAHGSYAVRYSPVGTPAPEGTACHMTTDIVGVQKYTHNGEAKVYLIPIQVGTWNFYFYDFPPAPGGANMAVGLMSQKQPDDNDICAIDSFERNVSETVAAAAEDDTNIRYEFSDMTFVVNPGAPGTIMKYRVKVSSSVDACEATYDAVGMFPVVSCGDYGAGTPDPDGAGPLTADVGTGTPTDENCAHADHFYTGLALNPAFDVKCEANDFYAMVGRLYYSVATTNPVTLAARQSARNGMKAFCAPRTLDPAGWYCPDAGCSWQQEHE